MKAKEKQQTTDVQMNQLTEENRALNERVDLLMKELQVLRSLYKELKQDVPSDSLQTMARVNTH
jgi:predicted nuclease with TOPRIM domain